MRQFIQSHRRPTTSSSNCIHDDSSRGLQIFARIKLSFARVTFFARNCKFRKQKHLFSKRLLRSFRDKHVDPEKSIKKEPWNNKSSASRVKNSLNWNPNPKSIVIIRAREEHSGNSVTTFSRVGLISAKQFQFNAAFPPMKTLRRDKYSPVIKKKIQALFFRHRTPKSRYKYPLK